MSSKLTKLIALPCRYVIVCSSMYHTCELTDGCVCAYCNPYLTDISFTVKLPTLIDFKNGGIKRVVDPDGIPEITDYHDPKNELDLDAQCPAGYTWEQIQAKGKALDNLCPKHAQDMNEADAHRINTLIRNIHKTNNGGC